MNLIEIIVKEINHKLTIFLTYLNKTSKNCTE